MKNTECPILVVGGRTTGLTMACELARHGVPVRIIDKSPGIDPHCRATVIHSRTLEIFQDLGIVDAMLAEGAALMGGASTRMGSCFCMLAMLTWIRHIAAPWRWARTGQKRFLNSC
jgi:2-polyprenyl-6-methoxyphenol hydroxylase-like FAD-dependent oxidoreductase